MNFTKMHGLGNDFILLESNGDVSVDYNRLSAILCDRHVGIGADGIMVVMKSEFADIGMRIINADGSEAEMCGNGIRCFARYVYDHGLVSKHKFTVETLAGIMEPELVADQHNGFMVKVNMGKPELNRKNIPMQGPEGPVTNEELMINGERFIISSLLMGVPHTMVFVDCVDEVDVSYIGPIIERHPIFPRKTNVNFVEVINEQEIKIRTWERGAGVTLACGTGSCASVVAANIAGKMDRQGIVHLPLGDLYIEWTEEGTVYMTGPAQEVFRGQFPNA